jgi:hypothetical protein
MTSQMYLELEVPLVRGPRAQPLFSIVLDWYLTDTHRIQGFTLPSYLLSRSELFGSLARTFEG